MKSTAAADARQFLCRAAGPWVVLCQILVSPSAWRARLADLDASLEPGCTLTDLLSLRNRAARALALQGVLGLPLLVSLFMAVSALLFGKEAPRTLGVFASSFEYGFFGALVLSAEVNLTAGIVYGAALSFCLSFMPGSSGAGLFYALSAAAGLAASVLFIYFPAPPGRKWTFELRGLALSLAGSAALLYLSHRVLSGSLTGLQPPFPGNPGISPADALKVALSWSALLTVLSGLTHRLRHPLLRRQIFLALLVGALAGAGYYGMSINQAPRRLAFAGIGGGLMVAYFFSLAFILALRGGSRWAAAGLAAFMAGPGWMPFAPFIVNGFSPRLDRIVGAFLVLLIAMCQAVWRPLLTYLPFGLWNRLLFWSDQNNLLLGKPSLFRLHAAFLDDLQQLPWIGLEQHLLLLESYRPAEAREMSRRLAGGAQAWAAAEAQIELAARRFERCETLYDISQVYAVSEVDDLTGPANPLLQNFSQVSREVEVVLKQPSPFHARIHLGLIVDRLEKIGRDLVVSREPAAARFAPILELWLKIIHADLSKLAAVPSEKVMVENPYIFGAPIDSSSGLFTGRVEIAAEIERHILFASHTPILIRGERFMGKTSLLLNLAARLPERVIPMLLDSQSLASFEGLDTNRLETGVLQFTRSAVQFRGVQFPPVDLEPARQDYAGTMNAGFERINDWLAERGLIGLIMIDDLEDLIFSAEKSSAGPYPLDLFRHISQHLGSLRLLYSSALTDEELGRWSDRLVSMVTLPLGFLSPEETRRLIARPVEGYRLKFEPGVVDKLADLTGGHPHLTQVVCHELVDMKNGQNGQSCGVVSLDDAAALLPRALHAGSLFFIHLERRLIPSGSAAFLESLARSGELPQAAHDNPDLSAWLPALRQRGVLAPEDGGGVRFQVELVRHWFAWPERVRLLL